MTYDDHISELRDRIEGMPMTSDFEPLVIHNDYDCSMVHKGRTHDEWWESVQSNPEQARRDHFALWRSLGVQFYDPDAPVVSSGKSAGTSARDPSS